MVCYENIVYSVMWTDRHSFDGRTELAIIIKVAMTHRLYLTKSVNGDWKITLYISMRMLLEIIIKKVGKSCFHQPAKDEIWSWVFVIKIKSSTRACLICRSDRLSYLCMHQTSASPLWSSLNLMADAQHRFNYLCWGDWCVTICNQWFQFCIMYCCRPW